MLYPVPFLSATLLLGLKHHHCCQDLMSAFLPATHEVWPIPSCCEPFLPRYPGAGWEAYAKLTGPEQASPPVLGNHLRFLRRHQAVSLTGHTLQDKDRCLRWTPEYVLPLVLRLPHLCTVPVQAAESLFQGEHSNQVCQEPSIGTSLLEAYGLEASKSNKRLGPQGPHPTPVQHPFCPTQAVGSQESLLKPTATIPSPFGLQCPRLQTASQLSPSVQLGLGDLESRNRP